jgi:hypothetical protein
MLYGLHHWLHWKQYIRTATAAPPASTYLSQAWGEGTISSNISVQHGPRRFRHIRERWDR